MKMNKLVQIYTYIRRYITLSPLFHVHDTNVFLQEFAVAKFRMIFLGSKTLRTLEFAAIRHKATTRS